MKGHLKIVEILITLISESPIIPNALGQTPIHYASKNGHANIVELLMGFTDENKRSVQKIKYECTELAMETSDTGNVNDLINMIDTLNALDNDGNTTQIHMAALNGHTDIVKSLSSLTDKPNSPNTRGKSPIHYAARRGHTEVVKELISQTNSITNPINAPDQDGMTPIRIATLNGHKEVVKTLATCSYPVSLCETDISTDPSMLEKKIQSGSSPKLLPDQPPHEIDLTLEMCEAKKHPKIETHQEIDFWELELYQNQDENLPELKF